MGQTVEDFPLAATAASSDTLDWTAEESPSPAPTIVAREETAMVLPVLLDQ